MARGKYGVSSVVDTPYNRFAEDKARKAAAYTPEGRATLEAEKNAPDPKQIVGNDFHSVIIAVLIIAGLITLGFADINVNGSTSPFNPIGELIGSSGAWATATVGPMPLFSISGHDYWITTWEFLMWILGIMLLIMARVTKPQFKASKAVAGLFGVLFIGLGFGGFFFGIPFGS